MPVFKKYGKTVFGVEFSSSEKKIIDKEVGKIVIKAVKDSEKDIDASILWMLHTKYGFGRKKLREVWHFMAALNKEYEAYYDLEPGEGAWVARKLLSDYGVDLDAWYDEEEAAYASAEN